MDKVALAIHDAHIQYDKRARDNERSCARLLRVDTRRFVREESDGYGKRTNQRTTVSAHRSCTVGSQRRSPHLRSTIYSYLTTLRLGTRWPPEPSFWRLIEDRAHFGRANVSSIVKDVLAAFEPAPGCELPTEMP